MTTKINDRVPTAKQLREQIAMAEAEKAAEAMRKHAEAEAEKRHLLEAVSKPSLSDEEAVQRGVEIIQRAVRSGQTKSRYTGSQRIVHRPRARHQSDRTRLGEHADRRS